MIIRGEAMIPPTCPAVIGKWKSGNIGAAEMGYYVYDAGKDGDGNPVTEICVDFRQNNEPVVEVRSLRVPVDSDLSNKARDLAKEIDEGKIDRQSRAGGTLKERVTYCRGVVDGECWALGPTALRQVLTELPE